MLPTRTQHPIVSAPDTVPPAVLARRRHTLGIVLLMAGTAWLTLLLTGQTSAVLPICWVNGVARMFQPFSASCGDLSLADVGYGMLVTFGVHYT